jgi:hypothetical protein
MSILVSKILAQLAYPLSLSLVLGGAVEAALPAAQLGFGYRKDYLGRGDVLAAGVALSAS